MRVSHIVLIAALSAVPGISVAQDAQPADPAMATAPMQVTDPQQFTDMATVSNLFEIQSSQLALTKANDQKAKDFAQHMVDDHTKAGEEMKAAATAQSSVTVPTSLDAKHQALLDKLTALNGAEFDQAFLDIQKQAHVEAVALFQGYADNGSDGALKDFAKKTLPTLQEHLTSVSDIAPVADSGTDSEEAATDAQPVTSILATGYTTTDEDNLVTEIVGQPVYSSSADDAEKIGDIDNLVIGKDGAIGAVIISVGGFLGIGEKHVAVNYDELQYVVASDKSERYILPTTKDALEAAPDFQTTDQPGK